MPLKNFVKHPFSEKCLEYVQNFDCNISEQTNFEKLNIFLKKDALRYQQDGFSKTNIYVANDACIAYYSLSMNAIKEKKIDVDDEYRSLRSYPALFLTRFAVDKSYQKSGIGKAILNDIIKQAYKNQEVGARFLFVDANPEAASWYLGNPLFTVLYFDLTERIEKCIEKEIIDKLNIRLKQGHTVECELDKSVHIAVFKKNYEKIMIAHVNDIFEDIINVNSILKQCHSNVKLTFENNKPNIKLEHFNIRQNSGTICDWLKEEENILKLDVTVPLYIDINKYYEAIYG